MKTFFLTFEGNPQEMLAPLTLLDPSLKVVTFGPSIHCLAFEGSLSEMIIVNALRKPYHRPNEILLIPAEAPYPPIVGEQKDEVMNMIAGRDDNLAVLATI